MSILSASSNRRCYNNSSNIFQIGSVTHKSMAQDVSKMKMLARVACSVEVIIESLNVLCSIIFVVKSQKLLMMLKWLLKWFSVCCKNSVLCMPKMAMNPVYIFRIAIITIINMHCLG